MKTEHPVECTFFSVWRTCSKIITRTCVWLKSGVCCTFVHLKSHPLTTCSIEHSWMCLTHFLPFVPRHLWLLWTTPTAGPMTAIRRSPAPLRSEDFSMAAWSNTALSQVTEPNTSIDASSEHTPVNYSSRRNSFNTDYNDLTTTVAACEPPDMKEVGRSTSPKLSQEREVSPSVSLVFISKR